MKLADLLAPWVTDEIPALEVKGIQNDSRLIKSGDLFVAYPGAAADGRKFMAQAEAKGAAAIVYEPGSYSFAPEVSLNIPAIAFSHLAELQGALAARFFDNPSKDMTIIGVTGTNGKTTIAYQLAQAYELLGRKTAYLGTLGEGSIKSLRPLANTTPDGLNLQQFLANYKAEGVTTVAMEVSSHALSLNRVAEVYFNQAIYTNLTHDHLDFHEDMANYAASKAKLFAFESVDWAILNADDDYVERMASSVNAEAEVIYYGFSDRAQVKVTDWYMDMSGSELELESTLGRALIKIPSLGKFNVYNALAVFSSMMASGIELGRIVEIMPQLSPAPGRLEIVAQDPCVIVDYAHTPDALANVLRTLQQVKKGNLWVVFGCGGDRDKTKRPLMGEIAAELADRVIITSDNPRTEDPEAIIAEIVKGLPQAKSRLVEADRSRAIQLAIAEAKPDDIVLIAGKGHEAYQQIGQEKHPFSDQDEARKAVKAR